LENLRKVIKITKGRQTVDGAGVKLVRVFGKNETEDYDPFLMLDAFDSENPEDYIKGFPWHPHRGIETITYLIHGNIEHGDSLGNSGTILDGECQWMTAGSGIIHQEMPKPSKRMLGAQLWLNLPAKDKMTDPAYGEIKAESVPIIDDNGVKVRVLSGEHLGKKGAFEGKYVKATYLDVELPPNREWSYLTEPDNTLFIYIFSGKAIFDPEKSTDSPRDLIDEKQAVLFGRGEKFWVKAAGEDLRFILLSANPLKEPVAWGGPIVMNTKDELSLAFDELKNNTFIKKSAEGFGDGK
jgi:redox-sensitive bicupin YhaK (pirin superfamily)